MSMASSKQLPLISTKKKIHCGVILATLLTTAHSAPFVIRDVEINGIDRLGEGAIFSRLLLQPGQSVDTNEFPALIARLYESGLFDAVDVTRRDSILVVNVQERPVINQLKFEGNKDVKEKMFRDVLEKIEFYEGQTFSAARLDEIVKNLYSLYESRGKYAVDINAQVISLPRNRVDVRFVISEGRTAQVKRIGFTGNEAFSDRKLRRQMDLSESGWLSVLTKDDRYFKEKLEADLEKIRNFYQNRGYAKFEVNHYSAQLSPDKKRIDIDIDVREGDQYVLKGVTLSGETVVSPEELQALVNVETGEPYSRKALQASIKAIQDRLGDEGYANAKVNPIPNFDEEAKTVDFMLAIDQGERAYVRRINIVGNERTQDEVFRREMRQMEGSWFVTRDVERSRLRIQRKPFVEEVAVSTESVGTDQVDVNYRVKERSASSILFGVSYGQESKFGLNVGLEQPNFMGTGHDFAINFATDDLGKDFMVSYTNPYFTDDGLSLGLTLRYREVNAGNSNTGDFLSDGYSANIRLGYPISEYSDVGADIGYENLRLRSTDESPIEIVEELGGSCNPHSTLTGYCQLPFTRASETKNLFRYSLFWQRDTRDRLTFATEGTLNRLGFSGTLPGSDDTFYKINLRHQSYFPLWDEDVVFSIRGDIGYGDGYSDTDGLPFYERYYAGGLRSVRGFRGNTLGPRYLNKEAKGGDFKVNGTAEMIMKIPGMQENRNLRWSVFLDAGQVYPSISDFEAGDLRYSTGVSLAWQSPIGPMLFSYGFPVNDKEEDRKQKAQFSIGIPF